MISFRTYWFDLLSVQGTLKSLLQHHSSKPSILWCSAFFTVQLSSPYMTTGKTIALTRRTFVSKVMSLLFNMLSRLVITLLTRSARSQHGRSYPWQRSWGRGLTGQRQDQASGVPLDFLEHLPPKTRVCLLYCVMLSTYSSDINRGLSPHHLFLEKVNLELLDNKSPGHNKSVSIQKPLWWFSSLPARLLQLHMWLFAASRLQEAQEA